MKHHSDASKAQLCLGSASKTRSGSAEALTGYRSWATVVTNPVTVMHEHDHKNASSTFNGSDGKRRRLESEKGGRGEGGS